MRKFIPSALLATVALSSPLFSQDDPATPVSAERLQADVETMVAFGTRHTLSSQTDPERGIGAALAWGMGEFAEASAACGDCLETRFIEDTVTGRRIPEPALIRNALAIQWGSERPNEVVIIQGHIDSRGSDVMDANVDAPGANDNASGSALVLEAARVLSGRTYPTTIVYALLSGEEQGLYGGRLLAEYARTQGWTVKAVLNNDIVGGSCGSDGHCDAAHVRVFSEGTRADASEQLLAQMRSMGGGNDSPSRNLSRWIDTLAEAGAEEFDVRQVWRSDRMGRGGDHIPFLEAGYPAIRFSVAIEDFDHQHQDLRVENGVTYGDTADEMDFGYLASVTRLNVAAADALARAPMPPVVSVEAAVRTDTLLQWQGVEGAGFYVIARRRTDEPYWREDQTTIMAFETPAPGQPTPMGQREISHIAPERGDDWIFGVASCTSEGICGPYASAVPGGGFYPLPIDSAE